jgi:hypothetical protein
MKNRTYRPIVARILLDNAEVEIAKRYFKSHVEHTPDTQIKTWQELMRVRASIELRNFLEDKKRDFQQAAELNRLLGPGKAVSA